MKILFCSDGSSQAETAARFGAQIAAACQAETSILGVTPKARGGEALDRALGRERDVFAEYELSTEIIAKIGDPEREIVSHTAQNQYDLVVIGAVCKNNLMRLIDPWSISVQTGKAYRIIESIDPPVLVVFCSRPVLRRILICTSGDAHTDKAVEFTGKLARCSKAVVNLFHVMQDPPAVYADIIQLEENIDRILASSSRLGRALRYQKDLLERLGVFGEIRLRHGLVVPELLKELKKGDYDLVVSGSAPAEQRVYKYLMGDITREIVNRAQLPVLVVKTGPRKIANLFKNVMSNLLGRLGKTFRI